MSLNFSENPPSLAFAPSVTTRPRSSLPSLTSVVRPVSPVRLETLDKGKSSTDKKARNASRPRSAIPSPSREHSAFSTKQLAPFPPSCPKPTKPSYKKRTQIACSNYIQPRKSPELGGPYLLAVVGKPVGKADKIGVHGQSQSEEKSNHDLVEEKVRKTSALHILSLFSNPNKIKC